MTSRGRPPHPDVLTPAEWNVLQQVREGLTNAEIGVRLGISPDGVKYHISNMLAKSGAADRHELAKWKPRVERAPRRIGFRAGAVGLGIAAAASGVVIAAVVAVSLFADDEATTGALPAARATRIVDTIVLERMLTLAPGAIDSPGLEHGIEHRERVIFLAPDLARIENLADGSVQVQDGNRIIAWHPSGQIATEFELAIDQGPVLFPDGDSLEQVVANVLGGHSAHYVGEGTFAGRPVYLVEGLPLDCGHLAAGRVELAIDKETLFTLRHAVYDRDSGDPIHVAEVVSIEYDTEVDTTEFDPPAGVSLETIPSGTWQGPSAEQMSNSDFDECPLLED